MKTLNEQVARARGDDPAIVWSRGGPEVPSGRKWPNEWRCYDPEHDPRDWAVLLEEMLQGVNGRCACIYALGRGGFVIDIDDELEGKTLGEAVCRAYLKWMEGRG